MKNLFLSTTLFLAFITSCSVTKPAHEGYVWTDVAVIQEEEVYTDTSKIVHKDGFTCAWVKTVYMIDKNRNAYLDNIRNSLGLSDNERNKRMKKWEGFSYNISYRIYDCTNKRYKITEVSDYTAAGKLIVTTSRAEEKEKWYDVGADTMGDYTLYYICDYGN